VVEFAIFFTLGALSAGLLALMAAPALSRRAMRLAWARARLLAPHNEKEALAERDALRAQHAQEQVRLERKMAEAKDAEGQARVELGRETIRLVTAEALSADRKAEIEAQREEIARLAADRDAAASGLAASQVALNDVFQRLDRAERERAEESQRLIALETQADRDRALVVSLETQIDSLKLRLADAEHEGARQIRAAMTQEESLKQQLADLRARHAKVTKELDEAIEKGSLVVSALEARTSELASGHAHAERLEARVKEAESAHESILVESARRLAELAERNSAYQGLSDRYEAALERFRAREDELAHENQRLATGLAAGEGALARTRKRLGAEAGAGAAGALSGDEALRQALAQLGAEVARLRAGGEQSSARTRRLKLPRVGGRSSEAASNVVTLSFADDSVSPEA